MTRFLLAQSSYSFPTGAPVGQQQPPLGTTGPIDWTNPVQVINVENTPFANLLDTASGGWTIWVREQIKIDIEVYDPNLIDIDFEYFKPHYKLGNWQVLDSDLGTVRSEGFLNYLEQTIVNTYPVILTSTGVLKTLLSDLVGELQLNWCKFDLSPAIVPNDWLGGIPPVTSGWRPALNAEPTFFGKLTLNSRASDNIEFVPLTLYPATSFQQLGLYLFPGAAVKHLDWRAEVFNRQQGVSTNGPNDPWLVTGLTCDNAVTPPLTCQELFQQEFEASQNTGIFGQWFTTQLDCQTASGVPCALQTWVCPVDANQEFTYWLPAPQ